jgi:hypothetical protein
MKPVDLKRECRLPYPRLLPVANWMLAGLGLALAACFMADAAGDGNRAPGLLLLWAGGPYLLLGLGCHLSRRNASAQRIGSVLLVILVLVPLNLYTHCHILAEDAQDGFILRSLPLFMWIYTFIAIMVLLTVWLNGAPARLHKPGAVL